jgi:c-di-GMP-binding flagellar brake protein YcgR
LDSLDSGAVRAVSERVLLVAFAVPPMPDKPTQADSERRRYKRLPLTTSVRYRKVTFATEVFIEQQCERANIGAGGIFLPTKSDLMVGNTIEMQFTIPSRVDKVDVIGRVVWISPAGEGEGVGVEFIKLDHKIQEEIMKTARRGQWMSVEETKGEKKGT